MEFVFAALFNLSLLVCIFFLNPTPCNDNHSFCQHRFLKPRIYYGLIIIFQVLFLHCKDQQAILFDLSFQLADYKLFFLIYVYGFFPPPSFPKEGVLLLLVFYHYVRILLLDLLFLGLFALQFISIPEE